MKTIKYSYSKSSSLFFTIAFIGFIGMSIPYLVKFINAHNTQAWMLISAFDFCITLMLLYVVIKQLIPALKGKIALEINSTGLISYVKDITIEWSYIDNIDLRSGKTSSALYITFKYETDKGSYTRIPLGFVTGNDEKIYGMVMSYFRHANN